MTRLLGIALPAGLDELLSDPGSSDAKLETIMRELAARQDLAGILSAEVASIRARSASGGGETQGDKAEKIPLAESVRLFGIQNAVMFLVAYKLADRIQAKATARDPKTGRLALAPHQILKHASEARQAFGEDGRYRDSAFAAGLVFDVLSLLISVDSPPTEQKKLSDFVAARFARGLKIGATAIRLARGKKDLKLERHLAAASLLREAAKAAMAVLFSGYPEFLGACEKSGVPLSLRNLAEQERYGGTYQMISKILAWMFEILSGAGGALTRCDSPHVLYDEKRMDEFDLASITFLAAHIERGRHLPKDAGGVLQANTLRPELRHMDLMFDLAAALGASKGGGK